MSTLYHYCSTSAFHALVQSKSVWLSSLTLSNDTMEGRLVAHVIARLAERDGLDSATIQRLKDAIGVFEEGFDGLGFCLSEDGDLLSQWRGYAADGTGVSIGFSRDYLNWLGKHNRVQGKDSFTVQRVVYDPDEQDNLIEPIYRKVKEFIDMGAYQPPATKTLLDSRTDQEVADVNKAIRSAQEKLSFALLKLFPQLFCLKSPAFREEQEWRLITYRLRTLSVDECNFRPSGARLIPYREFGFAEIERTPIDELILGPKHITPESVVQDFLRKAGFAVRIVRRSKASYR